jgi:two-component system, cell cycle sensor histidine kinase and response regulator CckA
MDSADKFEIRQLLDNYLQMYCSRDDRLTAYFSENFSGFTGGGDFLVKDRDAWVAITRQDFAQVRDPIHIELKDLALQSLSETVAIATSFFTIHLPIQDHVLSRETARLVLVFHKEPGGWKISHSSISLPDGLVREGEVYPLQELALRNRCLEDLVVQRTSQLSEAIDALTRTNEELAREIAEHRKAVEERQQFFRFFITSADLMGIADPLGNFKRVNPACSETLGYSEAELIARPFAEFIHPEDQQRTREEMKRQLEIGQSLNFENRYICKDGTIRWLSWRAIYNTDDCTTYATANDITERKLFESQLRVSEEHYRAIINAFDGAIYICAPDYTIAYMNELLIQRTGRNALGEPCFKALHELDDICPWCVNDRVFKGEVVKWEVKSPKDGRWYYVVNSPIFNADGTVSKQAMIHDITGLKQAELDLRKITQQYDKLVAKISVGVYILRSEPGGAFAFDYVSPRMAEILALSVESILADHRRAFHAAHPDDFDSLVTLNQEAIELRQSFEWEGRFLVEGSVKWLNIKSSPEALENGDLLWHGVVTDVTDEKLADEERLRLEKMFFHAQKLESLGILAGGIAHDFNNILMAIIGNADLALMSITGDSPAVENLKRIEQASARAADLTKQMLAYSGKGRFVLEDLDLNQLVDKMQPLLEISISKKAVLMLNLHEPLPPVEADATQMHQIIMNLVINASEALEENSGLICITTDSLYCDRKFLKEVWSDDKMSEGQYVCLEVADTGCGMDKNTMAKLFDPFFTTKFTGRGLGMAAVQGIVKGHKGSIKVSSEKGKGSTFKILLPASNRPANPARQEVNTDSENWRGRGIVLLVDDEETVRCIGAEMLTTLGFTPIMAHDGLEAIGILKRTPGIAFVILDLTMPRMDGEQCFRELRLLDPALKVIMSSGYNEQEVTQRFIGKGLSGFIQKPYKLSDLRDAIKKVV